MLPDRDNRAERSSPETNWISTSKRLPQSGQTVQARASYNTMPYVVTFQTEPASRWEGKHAAYGLDYFHAWRPFGQ